ncbi:transcription factor RF2b [Artemisia annua]|uniref:Transcription factor RF2b n=1 Tax=Artemisia annua TaxID=35608 RepID=A0A2U1Q2P9_ARTAN|nr:transcription factor RF2b [Artemisia annua]
MPLMVGKVHYSGMDVWKGKEIHGYRLMKGYTYKDGLIAGVQHAQPCSETNGISRPLTTMFSMIKTSSLLIASSCATQLKLRIQAMEQQAQLRDGTFRGFEPDQESPDFISDSNITDLIEALKQEVKRLRIETGEIANNSDGYNFGTTIFNIINKTSSDSRSKLSRHNTTTTTNPTFQTTTIHLQPPPNRILLAVFRGLISVTEVVTDDLARARHEYFNLILGIDFTKSKNDGNEGKRMYNEIG